MNDKVKKVLYGLLSVSSLALFVVVWVVLSHAEGTMLPTPTATFSRFIDIMQNPISKATLPVHIWVSLRRWGSAGAKSSTPSSARSLR